MCGIFGFVGSPEFAGSLDLGAAVRALHHRGPDDSGTFLSTPVETDTGAVSCAFAHTRLAILDLSSAGHQPMTTDDGRYTIAYNGEVFNFQAVRRELVALGESFRSDCDTEVILKAYVRWGRECLERFRGMFAFGIWDAQEATLFLARDRLGVKPLYYTETARGLAFASEVRTLLVTGTAQKKLSRNGVLDYLTFGSVYDPNTILAKVFSLLPGHYLEYRSGRLSITCYWSIPSDTTLDEGFDQSVAALKPLLLKAVGMRLISDVPLGIFLSGGIDSSVIVALAAEASKGPVHTFTVTFDEEVYSEERYAAAVASHFGCDHHRVHLRASDAAAEIDEVIKALDQPSADGPNTYFVSKAAKQAGLTVALSGLGGDELFAGYGNFRKFSQLLKIGGVSRLFPPYLRQRFFSANRLEGFSTRSRKLLAVLEAEGDPLRTYGVLRSMFTPRHQKKLLSESFLAGLPGEPGYASVMGSTITPSNGRLDPVNLFSTLELSNYLRNTLLRDSDTMSMAHSLEVRVPFLDHCLVERIAGIPGRLKLRRSSNKPLLTAVVPDLPREVVDRPKMGFTLPLEVWLRGRLRSWTDERLRGDSIRRLDLLDQQGVEQAWLAFHRGERYVSHSRVWCLATLAAWCDQNGIHEWSGS